MASDVRVTVSDSAIISALNTPGGAIFRWRDEVGKGVWSTAIATSPVNDTMNAQHRDGVVGNYKKGWRWNRVGSGGHRVRARVFNIEDYSLYVELGRSASYKLQIFSWTAWHGDIRRVGGPAPRVPRFNERTGRMSRLSAKSQAFNERLEASGLPPYEGTHTNARAGKHILARALAATLGSQGIV